MRRRAMIGGLITSTLLTLFVVPVAYTLLDDFVNRLRRGRAGHAAVVHRPPWSASQRPSRRIDGGIARHRGGRLDARRSGAAPEGEPRRSTTILLHHIVVLMEAEKFSLRVITPEHFHLSGSPPPDSRTAHH